MKSNTFIKEFRGQSSVYAINEANEYAEENNLDIVCVDSQYIGINCYLIVVFKKQLNIQVDG